MRALEESRSPPDATSRRRTNSAKRTRVTIHVYDLLQPGKLSSLLWHIGGGLLHSGLVVGNKEFAYGGHEEKGASGVYWNHPREEPPGCTFRAEVHQGWTSLDTQGVDRVVRELSQSYLGTDWNLLTRNCNHFTAALCRKLTGKPPPGWLNRAANIGITLPCMIPKEVLAMPIPDAENADGALVQEDIDAGVDDETGERRPMLRKSPSKRGRQQSSGRQTSWYDDGDGDDDLLHGQDNRDPARASKTPSRSLSRSDSTTRLLGDGTCLTKSGSIVDLVGVQNRAKLKLKDASGRIVRVSARVP